MSVPPPLRFLGLVVGGWMAVRAAVLLPPLWTGPAATAKPARPAAAAAFAGAAAAASEADGVRRAPDSRSRPMGLPQVALAGRGPASQPGISPAPPEAAPAPAPEARGAALLGLPPLPARRRSAGRWSGSVWLLARREDGGPALAPGGTLGGSQAGARLRYRLNGDATRPLALSARVYVPLRRPAGAEAALGLDWRPLAGVPVHLLAERRQALGPEGRSAFAATLYGGGETRLAGGRLRLEGYGQAGFVGLSARDAFADGSLRLTRPAGRLAVGAGAWGAAQPGAARLDVGPHLSWRLPTGGADLILSAEWRFRLAGDAEPGSGPAVTLAAEF